MKRDDRSSALAKAELERRDFLKKFGRFSVATSPLITLVLSAPASADGSWQSGHHHHHHHHQGGDGGGGGGDGWGGGGGDW